MTDDVAAAPRKTSRPVWSWVFLLSVVVGVVIFPAALLVSLPVLWFAGVRKDGSKYSIPGRLAITLGLLVLVSPVAIAEWDAIEGSILSCSNDTVQKLARDVISEKLVKSSMARPDLMAIKTLSDKPITCEAQVDFGAVAINGYAGQYTAHYTAEPTDDGKSVAVRLSLAKTQ